MALFKSFLCTSCVYVLAVAAMPSAVLAQSRTITVPSGPLDETLRRIEAQSGTRIAADPIAIRDLTSAPVTNARSAAAAVRAALHGLDVQSTHNPDGSIDVGNDIVVTAQRDEAETSVLVRATSTSDRLGQSLRDQPRTSTVISGKLIEQQQALTVIDALRNAAGVSVNTTNQLSGGTYSVRGFSSSGITNGLPGATSGGIAGATQSVANIERIEVLKGPDALLAGAENMGGLINIVTKRPFADRALAMAVETGSFGQARLTIDANNKLNDSGTVSARIVGAAGTADRNFGGYRGNQDYLFAPSLRFKDERTDILLDVSASNQIFGSTPYTIILPDNRPFDRPRDRPIRFADQGIQIESARYHADVTRTVGDWLTLAVRAQHEDQKVSIVNFAPLGVAGSTGNVFGRAGRNEQQANSDTVDGFVRIKVDTGPISHMLVAGLTHVWNDIDVFSSSRSRFGVVSIVTPDPLPLPQVDRKDYTIKARQFGQYGQYLLGYRNLKLLAGVRRNESRSSISLPGRPPQKSDAVTPNYGAVFEVARNLTLYGNVTHGYIPTFVLDAQREKLPNLRTRNREAGVKLDLFGGNALVNAAYFQIRQSVSLFPDPVNPGFSIALPGLEGKGVDLSVTGQILSGWTVQAGLTRTDFSFLTPSNFGNVVVGQPRDQYNIYTSYNRKVSDGASVGLGGGLFGRSSAAADSFSNFRVPASRQVDINVFATVGPINLNLGIRNLFDRDNYGLTTTRSYLPYAEPRNWRLTANWRFR